MTRLLYRLMTMVISVLSGMLAVDRATAEGARKLTGVWPGDDSHQEKAEEQD